MNTFTVFPISRKQTKIKAQKKYKFAIYNPQKAPVPIEARIFKSSHVYEHEFNFFSMPFSCLAAIHKSG